MNWHVKPTRTLRSLWEIVSPSFWRIRKINRQYVQDLTTDEIAAVRAEWKDNLRRSSEPKRASLITAYEQTAVRFSGFETKAAGLLSIASIVAIGAFAGLTGGLASVILGCLSLVYLLSVLLACRQVFVPRPRHTLLLEDVLDDSNGLAAMAVASKASEASAIRTANLVYSAVEDLAKAIVAAVLTVGILVLGHSLVSGKDTPRHENPRHGQPRCSTAGAWAIPKVATESAVGTSRCAVRR